MPQAVSPQQASADPASVTGIVAVGDALRDHDDDPGKHTDQRDGGRKWLTGNKPGHARCGWRAGEQHRGD
ncbi:MAG TPA: hypothetical protein VGP26_12985 [Actinophytocola sp.]|nr:hypothetical protein [Actinophytocola sp.]